MTLDEYMNAGAAWARFPQGADPAVDLAAAGILATTLVTKRDELIHVEQRCIISRLHREFLDRVLALMP